MGVDTPDTGEAAARVLADRSGPAEAVAEAPGRVNLIGEHTDYNGGLVLPAALEASVGVAVRFRSGSRVRGWSREEGEGDADLGQAAARSWLDYVRGVAGVLADTGRIPESGFDVGVSGRVPLGAGLASSAALQVASALALAAAAGHPFGEAERLDVARLCQRAESEFVGVPCGILDPFASLMARPDRAILLDCARTRWELVEIPSEVELLIVDTGVHRELRRVGYGERRSECERALADAQDRLGCDRATLSEISPAEVAGLGGHVPEVSLRRLRHVVTENERVRAFARALADRDLPGAGAALYASHESLRDDFEVTWPESDLLVEASREIPAVFGARMTGAGWGGCTVHLVRSGEEDEVRRALGARFEKRFGSVPRAWRTRAGSGARLLSTGD